MSNSTMQMMEMHSAAMQGMDLTMVGQCIEACSACEQACTMCAGSMAMSAEMAMCSGLCLNAADMANTMMRLMLRPNGVNGPAMMAALRATMMMCTSCADECEAMAGRNADCALCADVCRQCAMSCQSMIDSLLSAKP